MNMQEYFRRQQLGDYFFEYLKQKVREASDDFCFFDHWEDMVTFLYASSQTTMPWQAVRNSQQAAKTYDKKTVVREKKRSRDDLTERIKLNTDLCDTFLESFEQMEDPTMYAIALQKSKELHRLLKIAHPDRVYQVKDLVHIATDYLNQDEAAFQTLCKTECDQYRYISMINAMQQDTYQQKALAYCMEQYVAFEQADPSLNHAKLGQTVALKTLLRSAQTLSHSFAKSTKTKGGTTHELKKINGPSVHL